MCGRYVQVLPIDELAHFLEARVAEGVEERYRPSYNVPPTRAVPAVLEEEGSRVLELFRWGLIPYWAKPGEFRANTINARVESVAVKPSFRNAFRRRRVLVPANAYYEWSTLTGGKRPFLFERADGEPLVFAGIWEAWRDPTRREEAETLRSLAIITTPASPDIEIHDRMPAILERDAWERWIDPSLEDREELEAMLAPAPVGTLVHHEVSREVNYVRNDTPALIEALA
jgi:putative SOS response-associated peptidase YedK